MSLERAQIQKRLKFKNPPIVEAVIAIHIVELPELALATIKDLSSLMSERGYGQSGPVWHHEMEIKFENGVTSAENDRVSQIGWRFRSEDVLHAVQFNRTGMVFSRLGSYESWEQFKGEARALWDFFAGSIETHTISSIGVRYLNKLQIPSDKPIEEYINVRPHIPPSIPQRIDGVNMRLVLPIERPAGILVHNQMLLPPEKEGFASLLFDNDFQFETSHFSSEQVWAILDDVRNVKDDYFEMFTTQKMRDSFDA